MSPKTKKNTKLEIERKFLLRNVPIWGKKKFTTLNISQFYVEKNGKRIRYRSSQNKTTGLTTYYSTQKKDISKGVFQETEIEISERAFDTAFRKASDINFIVKKRFVYEYKGLKFEVDQYNDVTLVTLEVELSDIKQKIKFPNFILKEIITELTGMKEFSNFSLSKKI